MIAIIVKVQGSVISHETVHESTTFDQFVELVTFENPCKDIIIDDLVDVYIPEVDKRYALLYINE